MRAVWRPTGRRERRLGVTVTLTNTSKIVTLNGVPARVWEGKTAKGIPCHAFITVMPKGEADASR